MNPATDKLDFAIDLAQKKSLLRREILGKLKNLAPAERAGHSAEICKRLESSDHWQKASQVLLFHPLRSEPDVAPLLKDRNRQFVLPRVTENGLELHEYTGAESLHRSPFGMLEPNPESCALVEPVDVDLAIIPGVAFDPESRVRLGRGGGFYDRLLARENFRAITIGVGFAIQLRRDLPTEAHDQALDYLVTENS